MMQTQDNFKCRNNCRHKECHRHVNLGIVDRNQVDCANASQELTGSSIFLENVLDLSHTLAQIMIACGIHECKAKTAVDLITYAFLNYDLVCYCLDMRPSKRLRKEDLFHELGRKCLMNRIEAHLCYNIIKRGFKAFYYFPQGEEADLAKENNDNDKKPFTEECLYVHAAKRTAASYAQFEGLSCVEQRGVEAKILVIYKKFYDRLQLRKTKPGKENCNCCFCAKSRGHFIYAPPPPPPCNEEAKMRKKHTCPCCCKRKRSQKFIHPRTGAQKCATCHRSVQLCSCPKYQFDLNWIDSIWARPDMNRYYLENIDKAKTESFAGCPPRTDLEEEVEEAEENLPVAEDNLPEVEENLPEVEENLPESEDNLPVAAEPEVGAMEEDSRKAEEEN